MKLLENIQNYDVITFKWCLSRKNRKLMVGMARWISKTADGHLYVIIALVLLVQHEYRLCLIVASAFSIERCLYFVLKKGFRRKRPPQALPNYKSVIEPGDQFSLPSGHTSAAFLAATLISAFVPVTASPLLLWAVSVGMSRVVLGVHFPSDTFAGAILGMSIAQATLITFSYL